jgi:GNAT superfamily N-acetyltransferase
VTESTIRRARAADAAVLTAIAHAAKRHWGYPEHWIRAWAEELTVTRAYVAAHPVYLAEWETEIAAFYALRDLESRWLVEHFWVRPVSMGLGIGRLLFLHAVETARTGGCAQLLIDSDPNAAGFYERMGAQWCGTVSAPMDGCHRERPQYVFRLD